ncbi:hypothetical protein K435DRAFT_833949 [Dendrothele bispora CBS 962.96]|uniref:Uncharacterized protein n=1 Tax=Dendrothele bispora (strain CBS 962.96) TaxID=1314807 RepID=A0A4S8MWA1_DENBC|nr:hypothetical protein K435DRAFT_833949 [Dendrothele bispora CBS 962.96]
MAQLRTFNAQLAPHTSIDLRTAIPGTLTIEPSDASVKGAHDVHFRQASERMQDRSLRRTSTRLSLEDESSRRVERLVEGEKIELKIDNVGPPDAPMSSKEALSLSPPRSRPPTTTSSRPANQSQSSTPNSTSNHIQTLTVPSTVGRRYQQIQPYPAGSKSTPAPLGRALTEPLNMSTSSLPPSSSSATTSLPQQQQQQSVQHPIVPSASTASLAPTEVEVDWDDPDSARAELDRLGIKVWDFAHPLPPAAPPSTSTKGKRKETPAASLDARRQTIAKITVTKAPTLFDAWTSLARYEFYLSRGSRTMTSSTPSPIGKKSALRPYQNEFLNTFRQQPIPGYITARLLSPKLNFISRAEVEERWLDVDILELERYLYATDLPSFWSETPTESEARKTEEWESQWKVSKPTSIPILEAMGLRLRPTIVSSVPTLASSSITSYSTKTLITPDGTCSVPTLAQRKALCDAASWDLLFLTTYANFEITLDARRVSMVGVSQDVDEDEVEDRGDDGEARSQIPSDNVGSQEVAGDMDMREAADTSSVGADHQRDKNRGRDDEPVSNPAAADCDCREPAEHRGNCQCVNGDAYAEVGQSTGSKESRKRKSRRLDENDEEEDVDNGDNDTAGGGEKGRGRKRTRGTKSRKDDDAIAMTTANESLPVPDPSPIPSLRSKRLREAEDEESAQSSSTNTMPQEEGGGGGSPRKKRRLGNASVAQPPTSPQASTTDIPVTATSSRSRAKVAKPSSPLPSSSDTRGSETGPPGPGLTTTMITRQLRPRLPRQAKGALPSAPAEPSEPPSSSTSKSAAAKKKGGKGKGKAKK